MRITKRTRFTIDQSLGTRVKSGIRAYLKGIIQISMVGYLQLARRIFREREKNMECHSQHLYITLFSNASRKLYLSNTFAPLRFNWYNLYTCVPPTSVRWGYGNLAAILTLALLNRMTVLAKQTI